MNKDGQGKANIHITSLQAQSMFLCSYEETLVFKASLVFTLVSTIFIKAEHSSSLDPITHSEFWEICIKVSCHNCSFIWESILTFLLRSWESRYKDIKFLFFFLLNPLDRLGNSTGFKQQNFKARPDLRDHLLSSFL